MSKSRPGNSTQREIILFKEDKMHSSHFAYTPAQKRFVKKVIRKHARQKGKQIISKELIWEMMAQHENQIQDDILYGIFHNIHFDRFYCHCKECRRAEEEAWEQHLEEITAFDTSPHWDDYLEYYP